jgi:lysine 2,3-aminomutase
MIPDHPKLTLDSLHEEADSPVKGLVHRYPDKALFLRMSHPPPPSPLFIHLPPTPP